MGTIQLGGPADKRQEDGQNGLPTVSGNINTVGSGVQTKDDRVGADILGTAEGAGRVRGIREGDGGGFSGIPTDNTAWKGEGRAMELGSLGHKRRPADVFAGLPDQGRAEELPCGGMPRKGWDTDSDADAFLQLACPGHFDHLGGGKPPTPKMLTMLHAGPMVGTQR